MNFLFAANTPRDPLAGASGCDISVITALRAQGHEVDEIWSTDMPRRIQHSNLHQLLELPGNFASAVASKCESKQYDVIQVNQPHAWLAAKQHRLSGRSGVFINRSHGWEPALRRAVARYGSPSTDPRSMHRKVLSRFLAMPLEHHNRLAVRWSDGVVLCSIDDFDYIIAEYGTDANKLIPLAPGIDPFFLQSLPEVSAPSRWDRMIYIGNFCPPKAPEVVAEVFRRVVERVPNFRGTWVCPAQFHGKVRQLLGSAANQIVCRDWMTKEQLRDLLDEHALLLFPSYFEGFALTFLQAMARGVCVLGTKVDGMRQTLRDGENGYLFERGDASGIAERAMSLLKTKQHLQKIASTARETAVRFTWDRTATQFVEFCERRLEHKRSGHTT
jgi:glycosyltransferase involved in cell wall biosynthesis